MNESVNPSEALENHRDHRLRPLERIEVSLKRRTERSFIDVTIVAPAAWNAALMLPAIAPAAPITMNTWSVYMD